MQDESFSCLAMEEKPVLDERQETLCADTVSSPPSERARSSCYFCGNRYHPRNSCPARELTCHVCGKRGHFGKVCRSGKRVGNSNRLNPTNDRQQTAANMYPPHTLSDSIINVKVNNFPITALIDSGSSNSFIDHVTAQKLG